MNFSPITFSNYYTVSIDSTGQFLIAGIYGGTIYYSTDYAVSVASSSIVSSYYWYSSFTSGSGQYGYAVEYLTGTVWYSMNYGASWTQYSTSIMTESSSSYYFSITCDLTGAYVYGTSNQDFKTFYSTDYGSTWSSVSTGYGGNAVAGTASKIYTASTSSSLYYFSLSGSTMALVSNTTVASTLLVLTVDTSGQAVAGGSSYGYLYYTTSAPSNFYNSSVAPFTSWLSISSSDSGQYVTAGSASSGAYYSSDYGASYTLIADSSSYTWRGVSINSDGQYQVAVAYNTIIFSSDYGATWSDSFVGYPTFSPTISPEPTLSITMAINYHH